VRRDNVGWVFHSYVPHGGFSRGIRFAVMNDEAGARVEFFDNDFAASVLVVEGVKLVVRFE